MMAGAAVPLRSLQMWRSAVVRPKFLVVQNMRTIWYICKSTICGVDEQVILIGLGEMPGF